MSPQNHAERGRPTRRIYVEMTVEIPDYQTVDNHAVAYRLCDAARLVPEATVVGFTVSTVEERYKNEPPLFVEPLPLVNKGEGWNHRVPETVAK